MIVGHAQVVFVAACRQRMDIVVVLDASGSIRQNNFDKAKAFLADTIDQLNVNSGRTRVGLVTFGNDVRLRFQLNKFSSRWVQVCGLSLPS